MVPARHAGTHPKDQSHVADGRAARVGRGAGKILEEGADALTPRLKCATAPLPAAGEQHRAPQESRELWPLERRPDLERNHGREELGDRTLEVARLERISVAVLKLFPKLFELSAARGIRSAQRSRSSSHMRSRFHAAKSSIPCNSRHIERDFASYAAYLNSKPCR